MCYTFEYMSYYLLFKLNRTIGSPMFECMSYYLLLKLKKTSGGCG